MVWVAVWEKKVYCYFFILAQSRVIAVDKSHNKVLEIHNLAAELGLTSIKAHMLDARRAVCKINLNGIRVGKSQTSQEAESVTFVIKDLPNLDKVNNIPDGEGMKVGCYKSKSEERKLRRRMKSGLGRNQSTGGRVDKCQGFSPNSFD